MSWEGRYRQLAQQGPRGVGQRLLYALLLPLSLCYGWLGWLRAQLYLLGLLAVYRAPVPVISVGNLSVGGTGKTPTVDFLVRHLLRRGKRVAVVSRGYGGAGRPGVGVVSRGDGRGPLLPAAICGDEPRLLARRNPAAVVLVAPRRRQGVEAAVAQFGVEVVILDDGFQHLAVARDLDIVLLDAGAPFGNGQVLPAGLLRERRSALSRGDLFILTRSVPGRDILLGLPGPVGTCRHHLSSRLVSLDGTESICTDLVGKRGVAFAGIADPEQFFAQLRSLGLDLQQTIGLPDHSVVDAVLLARLAATAAAADFFVTTEKDGVKLQPGDLPLPCYQAVLELEFDPEGLLERAVDGLFS